MDTNNNNELLFLVSDATETRKYQHLYLRGNYQEDMFYDMVDKINAWNRLWLSAAATGVQILSVEILNNHLHISALIEDDKMRSDFKHHFRLSITQYHNRRYCKHGMLGDRKFRHSIIKDVDDLKDCICYHIRNVSHHGVMPDFFGYPFSTAKYVYGLAGRGETGVYNYMTLPDKNAYLPVREDLPVGWVVTCYGMIVPPAGVFRADMVEAIFGSKEAYMEQLSHKSTRETDDPDISELFEFRADFSIDATETRTIQTLDEMLVAFVKEKCQMDIPSMNDGQKMEAIVLILDKLPHIVNPKLLGRLFGIPYTTLQYRLKHSYRRD